MDAFEEGAHDGLQRGEQRAHGSGGGAVELTGDGQANCDHTRGDGEPELRGLNAGLEFHAAQAFARAPHAFTSRIALICGMWRVQSEI